MINIKSDQDLVILAQQGNYPAFSELVSRHQQRMYTIAFRILGHQQDAEDAVQTAFVAAIEGITNFRHESSFLTWMGKITTNLSLKALAKRHKREATLAPLTTEEDDVMGYIFHPEYIADWSQEPAQLLVKKETHQLLSQFIDQLDEKYRLVFILRDIAELTTKETAELLSISIANVKVRLLRARLFLREKLTQAFGDPESHQKIRQLMTQHQHQGAEEGKTPISQILAKYSQSSEPKSELTDQ